MTYYNIMMKGKRIAYTRVLDVAAKLEKLGYVIQTVTVKP